MPNCTHFTNKDNYIKFMGYSKSYSTTFLLYQNKSNHNYNTKNVNVHKLLSFIFSAIVTDNGFLPSSDLMEYST